MFNARMPYLQLGPAEPAQTFWGRTRGKLPGLHHVGGEKHGEKTETRERERFEGKPPEQQSRRRRAFLNRRRSRR